MSLNSPPDDASTLGSSDPERRSWREFWAFAVLGMVLASLSLVSSGALDCGFGAFDDEPSHLASGLMIHDWIGAGLPSDARAFAERFYVHYPKVALGQWPPGMPVLLAGWMLAFGLSTLAIQALFVVLSGLLVAVVARCLRPVVGPGLATVAGAAVLFVPKLQEVAHATMTEVPLALLCTASALAFGRFIDRGRTRDNFVFAGLAFVAILVKGSALALALVPPLAVLFTGRFDVLRRRAPWLGAALVGLGAFPWYWFMRDLTKGSWSGGSGPTWAYTSEALGYYGHGLLQLAGGPIAILALVGAVAGLARPNERGQVAALVAWILATFVFFVLIPTGTEVRHLTPLAPAELVLAALGAWSVLAWIGPLSRRSRALLAAVLLMGAFAPSIQLVRKDHHGAHDAAQACLAEPRLEHAAVLVASDSKGEGTLVVSIAMGEAERPGITVLRASKVLGSSDWMGRNYVPRFEDEAGLGRYLDDLPVGAIVFDQSMRESRWYQHHDLLQSYLAANEATWELVGQYDSVRRGQRFERCVDLYVRREGDLTLQRELTFAEVSGRSDDGSHLPR